MEARTHTNSQAINRVFIDSEISLIIMMFMFPHRRVAEINLIIIILAYSAIKISANDPLLYSVLNPETSSDSPSAKSKGVRLVSASVVVSQINLSGIIIIIGQVRLL